MSRSTGRVTLQDIARATGYTSNTVSRALKDKTDIAPETRKLIQKKAREMGYVRNYIASSLRSGRTKTIALISGTMSNPFYAVLADLIQREAFRLGYSLMILCSLDDPETEISMVEMALSRQVDGILIIPWYIDQCMMRKDTGGKNTSSPHLSHLTYIAPWEPRQITATLCSQYGQRRAKVVLHANCSISFSCSWRTCL